MPTESQFPPLNIPSGGLYDFLFERKDLDFPTDKKIYVDAATARSYTYEQVKSAAVEFGKGLKATWDWQKGDVLALYTPNCIDTPAVTWGTHWAGGIVSPVNPGYTVDELAFQLKDSGARALLTQLPMLEMALKAAEKVGISREFIALIGDERDKEGRVKHFTSIRNISGASRYRRTKIDGDKDLAFLVYSSGTTGLPKGVMLSHRNIIANTLQVTAGEEFLSNKPTKDNPDGDSILGFLPFFHIYGLTVIIHHALFRGFKCVVMAKFDFESWCKAVQEHRITMGYVVPPVVLLLAKSPIVDKYNLSSLKMLNSGAAPLTKELTLAAYDRTKVPIKQGYGLSETSPTTHMQTIDTWKSTIGSVGFLMPNMTAKYMSEDEKELPRGEVGELWLSGPNIFKGYLNNPAGTANALTSDNYFKTGDVGYQDEDGNFFITDRVKELIKYKGFQVPPAELEGYLTSHPSIDDVAVLGVHREDLATEVPMAFVVLKKGVEEGKKTEQEITEWLAKKVANHKRLRGGVRFVGEIPKSVSGKILRRVLKEKLKEEGKPKAKL
ncbi:unnamed protein product [Zymoseptoria tritici ST99CH_1A5]|uniref:Uncharacterized protein n=2 Tax=Zymoseptoria tritici TaxID=1047171 RepID=F9XFS6_ZYMTI|nr:uncharacterized protein MYCGRDRAFT_73985 [Zymoseptoria tritici IPO323]EGP86132.1 hypothetical protein MYCGRDRAFT_73985 [Zymoseptoria tritici IPO323]SMY26120.1 unnamed protein product [Zymoseptoria tritici ST99CH_1A5]